jgi:hypothetical protein
MLTIPFPPYETLIGGPNGCRFSGGLKPREVSGGYVSVFNGPAETKRRNNV